VAPGSDKFECCGLVHRFGEQIIVSKNGGGAGFDQLMPIGRKNLVSQKSDELAESDLVGKGGEKPMFEAGDTLNSSRPIAVDHDSLPATVSRAIQIGLKGLVGVVGYDLDLQEAGLAGHELWNALHRSIVVPRLAMLVHVFMRR